MPYIPGRGFPNEIMHLDVGAEEERAKIVEKLEAEKSPEKRPSFVEKLKQGLGKSPLQR